MKNPAFKTVPNWIDINGLIFAILVISGRFLGDAVCGDSHNRYFYYIDRLFHVTKLQLLSVDFFFVKSASSAFFARRARMPISAQCALTEIR